MANQEHLAILEQGVDIWNQWRKEHPDIQPDFSGAGPQVGERDRYRFPNFSYSNNLSGANLSGANLSFATLHGADLSGADLSGADLSGAYLNLTRLTKAKLNNAKLDANLSEAILVGAIFSKANLSGANLSKAILVGAIFSKANLSGADLSGAAFSKEDAIDRINKIFGFSSEQSALQLEAPSYLEEISLIGAVNFSGANLSGANFSGANLSGVALSGADLRGAALSGVNLSGADLRGATLSGVNFSEINRSGASLSGANLRGATLSGKDLSGKDLSNTDLQGANLSGTNLSRIILSGANLSEANLTRAIITEANLGNAILNGCSIYGIAAWDVRLLGAKQDNLVITLPDQPTITVDNLEVAQFIYLLLNHKKLRDVLNAVTQRGVLLLGRFGSGGLEILQAIAAKLREENYLPIMFDFERPQDRDYTETVKTLVGLARFVIVDLSGPSVPQELSHTVPFW